MVIALKYLYFDRFVRVIQTKRNTILYSIVHLSFILDIAEVQIFPVNSLNIDVGTKQVWIYCHVPNANPGKVSYKWTKSNSLVSTVVSSAPMYVIESAVEKDTGNYTCTAINSAGNSSGTVDIYVQCETNEHSPYNCNTCI